MEEKTSTGRRFAISDIHGCLGAFRKMLELLDFQPEDTMYIIGDMIDRGPDPLGVIELVRSTPNMVALMGNHEWMMLQYLDGGEYKRSWALNGNSKMFRFLRQSTERKTGLTGEAKEIVDWVRGLPYWVELDDYILIHAGWNQEEVRDQLDEYKERNAALQDMLEDRDRMELVWARREFFEHPCAETVEQLTGKKKTVIYGHTPTPLLLGLSRADQAVIEPSENGDKINIDCGAAYGGNLACYDLDNGNVYYTRESSSTWRRWR